MRNTKVCAIAAAAAMLVSCTSPRSGARPNIIVIVIDSLRARNLSCYGYERNTTPGIDSLAATGTLWANCLAQSSWTLPSMTSIFTGLTEVSHGAGKRDNIEYMLHPDAPFLANLMRDQQYRTFGYFNVAYLDDNHGFDRGFDSFRCEMGLPVRADAVTGSFMGWLDSIGTDEPFFAVLHLFDPHMPYNPPEPYNTMFGPLAENFQTRWTMTEDGVVLDPENRQHYIDLYDGETAFADNELSVLFAHLRSTGVAENTIILITADHGEEFYEHHGVGHGHTLYQELLAIPLIITGPGLDPDTETEAVAAQIDVLPTVLSICGLDVPEWAEGQNLLSPDRNVSARDVFSSLVTSFGPWVAVRRGSMKLHWQQCDDASMQFNLDSDPLETSMLDEVDSSLVESALWYWATPPAGHPEPADMDQAMINALRGLGYL